MAAGMAGDTTIRRRVVGMVVTGRRRRVAEAAIVLRLAVVVTGRRKAAGVGVTILRRAAAGRAAIGHLRAVAAKVARDARNISLRRVCPISGATATDRRPSRTQPLAAPPDLRCSKVSSSPWGMTCPISIE
jgi:hypothetical protein